MNFFDKFCHQQPIVKGQRTKKKDDQSSSLGNWQEARLVSNQIPVTKKKKKSD